MSQDFLSSTGVNGVSNSDGTLTISPTTGAVVASIAAGSLPQWNNLNAVPFVIVTPTGSASSGKGPYGPNTPGTSTAGIQEAIDALGSSGGAIFVVAGLYQNISSSIDTKGASQIIIFGAGHGYQVGLNAASISTKGTYLQIKTGSNITLFTNSTTNVTDLHMRDLLVDGNDNSGAAGIDFRYIALGSPGVKGLDNVVFANFPNTTNGAIYQSVTDNNVQINLDGCAFVACAIGIGDSAQNTSLTFPTFIDNTFFWKSGSTGSYGLRVGLVKGAKIHIETFALDTIAFVASTVEGSDIRHVSHQDADVFSLTAAGFYGTDATFICDNCGKTSGANTLVNIGAVIQGSKLKVVTYTTVSPSASTNTTLVSFGGNIQGVDVELLCYEANATRLIAVDLSGSGAIQNMKIFGSVKNTNTWQGTSSSPFKYPGGIGSSSIFIDVAGFNPVGIVTNFIDNGNLLSPLGTGSAIPASTDMPVTTSAAILTWSSTANIVIKDPAGTQVNGAETALVMRRIPVGYKVNVGAGTVTVTSTAFE